MKSLGCMLFYEYSFCSSFTMQGFELPVGMYYFVYFSARKCCLNLLKVHSFPWNHCFIRMLLFPSTQMDNECTVQTVIESDVKTEKEKNYLKALSEQLLT